MVVVNNQIPPLEEFPFVEHCSQIKLTFDKHNHMSKDGVYCRGDIIFTINIADDLSGKDAGKLSSSLWTMQQRLLKHCATCGAEVA